MSKILIIGGGWAGCSAALIAVKQGAEVTLLEKTDLLLGAGNVGGIMRNNGRFTAAEENIALGAGELFEIADINKTSVCPLARVMRRELKKRKIEKQTVLFSTEDAKKCALDSENGRHAPGSISFVPPAAGYLLASKCVRDIISLT